MSFLLEKILFLLLLSSFFPLPFLPVSDDFQVPLVLPDSVYLTGQEVFVPHYILRIVLFVVLIFGQSSLVVSISQRPQYFVLYDNPPRGLSSRGILGIRS